MAKFTFIEKLAIKKGFSSLFWVSLYCIFFFFEFILTRINFTKSFNLFTCHSHESDHHSNYYPLKYNKWHLVLMGIFFWLFLILVQFVNIYLINRIEKAIGKNELKSSIKNRRTITSHFRTNSTDQISLSCHEGQSFKTSSSNQIEV